MLSIPILDIALRTATVYLVVLLLIANAVQNAMVGPDTSLEGGILAVAVLLLLNVLLAGLGLRWPGLRRLVKGSPTLLVLRGEVIAQHMRREGLDRESLDAALREHGVTDLRDVALAVLEVDGSISVVPASAQSTAVKQLPTTES